jgi:UDP-2,4-diacetamido-2,4,6-trideoxy-beta-L-altropyranose hydrolase
MIAPPPLVFRADAGPHAGAGRLMRCLALAQGWQDAGGRAVFVLARAPGPVLERLAAEGVEVVPLDREPAGADDAAGTAAAAAARGAGWLVVDGHPFGPAYLDLLRGPWRLALVDDFGRPGPHPADLVLNQNACADGGLYPNTAPGTRLLLGPRYLLLRRAFRERKDRVRPVPRLARRLLVTPGGADPDDFTGKVLRALALPGRAGFLATVLAGLANPRFDDLRRMARACTGRAEVLAHAADMPQRLADAELAVGAGGTTAWEMAYMGVPAVLAVLADNQRAAAAAAQHGTALNLGWHADVTPESLADALDALRRDPARRRSMAEAGRRLVDGQGVERVCMHLLDSRVRLRRTTADDADLLYRWGNDPEVRARGFHTGPVPWDTHVRWLAGKLASADADLFVGLDGDDAPVGQVRLDRSEPDGAVISVSVARERRGQGLAADLIRAACRWGAGRRGLCRVHAYIKPDNTASLRAFARAGFRVAGVAQVGTQRAVYARLGPAAAERRAG